MVKLTNALYLVLGVLFLQALLRTSQTYAPFIANDTRRLTFAKETGLRVISGLHLDYLKGNLFTLASSLVAVFISLLLMVTKHNFIATPFLFVSVVILHFAILTIDNDSVKLIDDAAAFALKVSSFPVSQIGGLILQFFHILSEALPVAKGYMTIWINAFSGSKIVFPSALLFVLAFGLINKKMQLATCLFVPTLVFFLFGLDVTAEFSKTNGTFVSIQLLLLSVFLLVCLFNGFLQIEAFILAPIYIVSIIFASQQLMLFISTLIAIPKFSLDILFVTIYIMLFCLIFFKKIGSSLVPAFLVFLALSVLLGTIPIVYLVPVFFFTHSFAS
ncbi:hypothetical protein EIN_170770 [Entamoeba invadens IP1]|uniref:Uncharacterized protein n=1 Tax=Entamoeba invadens IP1 TaxID=370355 RepID=A0A0A1TVQ4_ENTIV|nr:hypothetical protein EIN_170770 [Entamoeba invadens IP1]ELP84542.1 hypothetical protein EIN_170770 [Entamoeba invadens IP1]|eukprot:XP_004183888.1 hypothetical protein EIN_170770 [Entamoeba invadens IP1]